MATVKEESDKKAIEDQCIPFAKRESWSSAIHFTVRTVAIWNRVRIGDILVIEAGCPVDKTTCVCLYSSFGVYRKRVQNNKVNPICSIRDGFQTNTNGAPKLVTGVHFRVAQLSYSAFDSHEKYIHPSLSIWVVPF